METIQALSELPNYTLRDEIGAGPIARVFVAEHGDTSRLCALKLVDLTALENPDVAVALKREGEAMAALEHHHVIRVHECGIAGHHFFLAMEFLEGGDLAARQGEMAWREAAELGRALADALAHAHERGVVHRGIKPANVLLHADGRPVLSDFGIAKIILKQSELSRIGLKSPAYHYMAPEQLRGRGATPQSDIYSLGVLLRELIAGGGPVPGDRGEAERQLPSGESELALPEACRPVEPLLRQMLAVEPGERPASAAGVRDALAELLERTGGTTPRRTDSEAVRTRQADTAPTAGRTTPAAADPGTVPVGPDATRPVQAQEAAGMSMGVGSTIRDRFRIEAILGEGGMGKVYYALDLLKEEAGDDDPYVALKVLHSQIASAEMNFMALQREARRSQDLAHPNIVTVFDLDRVDGIVYMSMEMLRGNDSAQHIAKHPQGLDPAEARSIIKDVAAGLSYAHTRGITHADLKPQNVFICEDGRAKLLDFGIARAHRAHKPDVVEEAFSGYTPAYASPEILEGDRALPADDVYALGCIAYYYFTGRHPFDKKPASVARDQGLKPKRPKQMRRAEWRAVAAALSFERGKRPKDAAEFIRRFAPSRVKQIAAAVSVLSIVVAVAVGLMLADRGGPEVPFEDLPLSTQARINQDLEDAALFMESGDVNAALQLYDAVLRVHPGNRRGTDGMEAAVARVLETIRDNVRRGEMRPEDAYATLDTLLAYKTLPESVRQQVKDARARI